MIKLRLLLVVVPALCAWLSGCRPPPLASYPYFWDRPTTKPQPADLAGVYKLEKLRVSDESASAVRERDPRVELNADGTAILTSFATYTPGETIECRLTGKANWELSQFNADLRWSLILGNYRPELMAVAPGCEGSEVFLPEMLVLGRKGPYRLYIVIGDPDSDTGVEFSKVRPSR